MEIIERPWGFFMVVNHKTCFKEKIIVVHPSHKLSLQRHKYRNENWRIISGTAKVLVNDIFYELKPFDSIFIKCNDWHRVENIGEDNLVIHEIQTGELVIEEDIERKEDDYGRI